METVEQIRDTVISYIRENIPRLQKAVIKGDMNYDGSGLGLDSLEMILMFIQIGKRYGIKVAPERLYGITSIDGFASYIAEEIGKKSE